MFSVKHQVRSRLCSLPPVSLSRVIPSLRTHTCLQFQQVRSREYLQTLQVLNIINGYLALYHRRVTIFEDDIFVSSTRRRLIYELRFINANVNLSGKKFYYCRLIDNRIYRILIVERKFVQRLEIKLNTLCNKE